MERRSQFSQKQKLDILKSAKDIGIKKSADLAGVHYSTVYQWQRKLDVLGEEAFLAYRPKSRGRGIKKVTGQQEKANETTTVKNLVAMLRNAILSRHRFIQDTCVRKAKHMAVELKRQYHYAGALKKKILDELVNVKELGIDQRKEAVNLMELVLSQTRRESVTLWNRDFVRILTVY